MQAHIMNGEIVSTNYYKGTGRLFIVVYDSSVDSLIEFERFKEEVKRKIGQDAIENCIDPYAYIIDIADVVIDNNDKIRRSLLDRFNNDIYERISNLFGNGAAFIYYYARGYRKGCFLMKPEDKLKVIPFYILKDYKRRAINDLNEPIEDTVTILQTESSKKIANIEEIYKAGFAAIMSISTTTES